MRKLAAATLLGLSSFLLVGCFDIEQTLTLERNLSGKAGFAMKINMEAMADIMLGMQRQMEGKTGDPTQAEIDKARKDFAASGQTGGPSKEDFEKQKKEMQASLPKGVTLLDATSTEEGLKMSFSFLFGFDNVSKLSQIDFPKDGPMGGAAAAPGAMPGGMPVDSPFGNLKITDEGGTILVVNKPENPMADAGGPMGGAGAPGQPPDPAMTKMMEGATKSLRVAFKITSPMTVVEQNAHRKEGNTLIWEFDAKTFEKMTPAQLNEGVKVRYKK